MKWTEVAIILVIIVALTGFITIFVTPDPSFEEKMLKRLTPLESLLEETGNICTMGSGETGRQDNEVIYTGILTAGESIHRANLLITRAISRNGLRHDSTICQPDSMFAFYLTSDNDESITLKIRY